MKYGRCIVQDCERLGEWRIEFPMGRRGDVYVAWMCNRHYGEKADITPVLEALENRPMRRRRCND